MADTQRQKLVHLHTSENRAPSASVLNYGEIAVMHNEEAPSLFIKTGENKVAQFVDKHAVETLISASTESFIALKSEVVTEQGRIDNLDASVITAVTVNGVEATLSAETEGGVGKFASVDITGDDIPLGTDITIEVEDESGNTVEEVYLTASTTTREAIQDIVDEVTFLEKGAERWNQAADDVQDLYDINEENERILASALNDLNDRINNVSAVGQTNILEGVQVNGTDLAISNKKVNVTVAEGTDDGTIAVNGTDIAVHGLGSAAFEDVNAFDESGAADTVKTEILGDATDSGDTLGKLEDRIEGLETGSSVSISTASTTSGYLKSYTFLQNGNTLGVIDIPKDLVVTSGQIVEENNVKYLRLTIANQDTPVDIAVTDLVDVYTEGNGIEISNTNEISAKVVTGNGLSVDANGIAMAAASSNGAGAMSASDFDKLASIAASAQVNTIEGIQVNGADLTPDANKKVNVTITSGSNNGTIAVNGSDVAVTGLKSAAFADASEFDESGAAAAASAAAITAVVGDMTGETKTLGALQDAIEGLDLGEDNILEGVQVNGSDLTPDANKKVNVTIAEGATDGTIAVNGTDVAVHGLGSAAYADTTNFDAAGSAAAASAAAVTSANSYTDAQVLSSVTAATGDTLVSASVSSKTVTVEATQALSDAVALANSALQGVSSASTTATAGVAVDANHNLDFTNFGVDCGEY